MNILTKLKDWLLRPLSKGHYYWKSTTTKEHIKILYYSDNSVYLSMIDKTGHEIAIVVNPDYVAKLRAWLNTHFYEGEPDESNGKVISLARKVSLLKRKNGPARNP